MGEILNKVDEIWEKEKYYFNVSNNGLQVYKPKKLICWKDIKEIQVINEKEMKIITVDNNVTPVKIALNDYKEYSLEDAELVVSFFKELVHRFGGVDIS